MNLPPELANRFTIVEELGSGGEGFVLRVVDDSDAPFVVKLYHPNLSFDETAASLLAGADPAHVVRMFESGRCSDGSRFEVLEWCEHGTLRDLLDAGRRPELTTLIRELGSALDHIHLLRLADDADARLVHQDLKPDNVMVRTLEPLDLVLGDFGLARLIAGSRHYTNRQQGSRAWAPPSGEAVTAGWDWWSLGMVIAEVAAGAHPFCVGGEWLPDAAISDHLSQGSVDLSGIDSERTRTLCLGLLTRRTADRWGPSEVKRWLAGESVRVAADAGGIVRRRRTVLFNGVEYSDPVDLALELQKEWDQAQEQLIQRTDGGALSQQVALFLSAAGIADADQLLKETDHPPTRLANLLAEMHPDLPPIYRGRDIRPAALATALTNPATAEACVRLVEEQRGGLASAGVLTCWRGLQGMADGPRTEARLNDARAFLGRHTSTLERLEGSNVAAAKAAVYSVAVQPEKADVARRALAAMDTSAAVRQSWWQQLVAETGDFAPILALQSEGVAREQTNLEDAKLKAERAVADQRRRAEQEAARRAQQQATRQRLERERSARRAETTRRWKPWSIPLVIAGALAMWLGVGLIIFVHRAKRDSMVSLLGWPFGWGWVAKVRTWWLEGPGEATESLDWLFGLEGGGTVALAVGLGLAAAGAIGLFLALMARKGGGIGGEGRLRISVHILRVSVISTALGGSVAFLPWAFVAVAGLAAVAIVLAVVAFVLWVIAMLLSEM